MPCDDVYVCDCCGSALFRSEASTAPNAGGSSTVNKVTFKMILASDKKLPYRVSMLTKDKPASVAEPVLSQHDVGVVTLTNFSSFKCSFSAVILV